MRRITRGGGAYILIALFSIPLALVGYEWLSTDTGEDHSSFALIVIDGDEEITVGEIRRRARFLLEYRPDIASGITEAELNEFVMSVSEQMTREFVLDIEADRRGMRTPVELVNRAILRGPWFRSEGKFSPNLYKSQLLRFGYSPVEFRDVISRQENVRQLLSAYQHGTFYRADVLGRWAEWYELERDVHYLLINDTDLLPQMQLDEDAVMSEYEDNKTSYLTDDFVRVKYFLVDRDDYYKEVPEERVEESFQQELALLRSTQDMWHILLRADDERADSEAVALLEDLRDRHQAGADFGELARQYSEDYVSRDEGGYLGEVDKELLPEELLRVLQELTPGSVSEPVRTELGWHLVYAPAAPDVDEAALRADVRLRLQEFRDKNVYRRQIDELREIALGTSFLEDMLGGIPDASVEHSPVMSRLGLQGAPDAKDVALFEEHEGLIDLMFSDVVLNGEILIAAVDEETTMFAQLEQYTPPAQMTIEDARPDIERALRMKMAREHLPDHVADLVSELREVLQEEDDEPPGNPDWQRVRGLKRYDREHHEGSVAGLSFSAPAPRDGVPQVRSGSLTESSHMVVVVSAERSVALDDARLAEISQRFSISAGLAYSSLYVDSLVLQHEIRYPSFRPLDQ